MNEQNAGRFGKLAAKRDFRTLRFATYAAELPAPPPSFSILPRVEKATHEPHPMRLFPMDHNDSIGNCTIAAACHAITVYNGMIGKKRIPGADLCRQVYFHLSGGTDSGLVELDVLNYWRQNNIAGEKILAFVSVNPHSREHVQQAIATFGCVYLGFQVQQGCQREFAHHQPWTPGPLLNEGHAVLAVAYDADGVTVLTWGATQRGTWNWWEECVDECYALLPSEAAVASFAPGFDLAALQADLAGVTG